MIKSKMHKLILNKKRFDILSADTDFYKFVDDSRLYHTFERLICEEDRQKFIDNVENGVQGWFVVHMTELDGSQVPCYMSISESAVEDNIEVILLDISMLVESEKALDIKNKCLDNVLALYGDDSFVYYPDRDEVEMNVRNVGNTSQRVVSVDELEVMLKECVSDYAEVANFIHDIRNGSRYFGIKTEGSINHKGGDVDQSIIKGTSLYDGGKHIMSVGYIHEYVQRVDTPTSNKFEMDSLTGLIAKGPATNIAIRTIDVDKRENVSMAILDIDHFKQVNDTFGHMVGDSVLRQVSAIIAEEVGNDGMVGRIGGDEFLILFYDAYDLEDARARLRSIKNTVSARFPADVQDAPAITLSIGCAAYPKDADNYEDLFALADFALYRAKEKGRNRYIIYDLEKHGTLEEIRKAVHIATRINNRGDLTLGEIMCLIMDKVFGNEEYPVDRLIDDYLENFDAQRVTIYDVIEGKAVCMMGEMVPPKSILEETQGYIHSGYWQKKYLHSEVIINDITTIKGEDEQVYELMKKQGVLSCIHIKFVDKTGRRYVLSLESVSKRITWNTEHLHYYRLMAKILSEYKL